jgi:hypothetical protein
MNQHTEFVLNDGAGRRTKTDKGRGTQRTGGCNDFSMKNSIQFPRLHFARTTVDAFISSHKIRLCMMCAPAVQRANAARDMTVRSFRHTQGTQSAPLMPTPFAALVTLLNCVVSIGVLLLPFRAARRARRCNPPQSTRHPLLSYAPSHPRPASRSTTALSGVASNRVERLSDRETDVHCCTPSGGWLS